MNISRVTNPAGYPAIQTPLGHLRTDDLALKAASEEISAGISDAVDFFPESVRPAMEHALEASRTRVAQAGAGHKLNRDKVALGLEMLREMTEGLGYLARGEAEIIASEGQGKTCSRWSFKTPTNDIFRVRARPYRDRKGQARIGITQLSDDGVPVPKELSLDVRFDRDPRHGATIDIEFGKDVLNRQIHGYKRVKRGKKFVNHHFRAELPRELNKPNNFAQVVHDFRNDTLTVLA